MFTGARNDYSKDKNEMGKGVIAGNYGVKMPHGYVKEEGTAYRMGALYAGIGETRIGINSDRYVRHPIQDIFAHDIMKPQPGFKTLSNSITPYYQINFQNLVNPVKTPRFTLYD